MRLVRACVIGGMNTDLVADGYGINMRPCTRNNLVLLGLAHRPGDAPGRTTFLPPAAGASSASAATFIL